MSKKLMKCSFLKGRIWNPLFFGSCLLTLLTNAASALDVGGSVKEMADNYGRVCALTTNGDLYCWGRNISTQVGGKTISTSGTPVKIFSKVKKFAIPGMTNFALKNNGDLYGWGSSPVGQSGGGKDASEVVPTKILSNVEDIYPSEESSVNCAITKKRDLYCWGANQAVLGTGTEEHVFSPTKILSDVKDFSNNSSYYGYACASTNSGELYCWGYNSQGSVGNGTTDEVRTPTNVLNEVEKFIIAGSNTCAITNNADLYCWGNGTLSPKKVGTQAIEVNGDDNHLCYIKKNGNVYCWGKNQYGQVGNKSTVDVTSPVKVFSKAVKVFLNNSRSCAIRDNGNLYCWGLNTERQLGGKKGDFLMSPTKILDDATKVVFGNDRFCAIETNGHLHCWGKLDEDQKQVVNAAVRVTDVVFPSGKLVSDFLCTITTKGELLCAFTASSYNSYNYSHKPKKVLAGVSNVIQGYAHDCAIKTNGDLYCWGSNTYGDVGNGTTEEVRLPFKVLNNVASIYAGTSITYALQKNGNLYVWGAFEGNDKYYLSPVKLLSNVVKHDYSNHSSGYRHACALQNNGDLYCWGDNYSGQVGIGRVSNKVITPANILHEVKDFAVGDSYACAVKTNGDLYCWGSNLLGSVGSGEQPCHQIKSPTRILGNVAKLKVEHGLNCAILNNSDLYCWGSEQGGLVGNGTEDHVFSPVKILSGVRDVKMKSSISCAIKKNNDLYCWGKQYVGNGKDERKTTPVKILSGVADITLNGLINCALKTNNDLLCWGRNDHIIQYGHKTQLSPTKVLSDVSSISLFPSKSCAITNNGDLYCWGKNDNGSIGNNSTEHVSTPVQVLTDVISVSNSCAVKSNHNLYCWGYMSTGGFNPGEPFGKIFRGKTSGVSTNNNCSNHWKNDIVDYSCDNAEVGACLNSGVYGCYGTVDAPSVVCNAEKGTPKAEMCDGIDNDCDGQIDEDFALLGKTCYVGSGTCKTKGVYTCKADGTGTECYAKLTNQCELLESDANNNGIPDLYEKAGDIKSRIVRPNTKLMEAHVVKKGKKQFYLYFEWFNGASYYNTEKKNDKNLPFSYYVRVKITNLKTGKVMKTNYHNLGKVNKMNIGVSDAGVFKFTVDYRVKIKKGAQEKQTPWSPKIIFQ